MTIGVIVLAAGHARRFGSDKRMALMADGQSVLAATLARVCASGLDVLLCLGAGEQALQEKLALDNVNCTLCPNSSQGMGATLSDAMAQVPGSWSGVLVALGDMPWIETRTYLEVAEQLQACNICRPECDGRPGHPVGFGRRFFPELSALSGDQGGRDLLERYSADVRVVAVADPGVLMDIDHPDDIKALPGR